MTKPYFTLGEAAEIARCPETLIFQYAETNKLTVRWRTPDRLWLELPAKAAFMFAEGADIADWEEFSQYPTPTGEVISHSSKASKSDIYLWPEDMEVLKRLVGGTKPSSTPTSLIEWLGYSTPALEALDAAARKFWVNYDPNRPTKKEIIIDWLQNEHGLSKHQAEAIDSIIRPLERRRGGNVKRSRGNGTPLKS